MRTNICWRLTSPPAGTRTRRRRYAGEGIYDWLRHREPRWSSLAIIHRLDKETSGVLVFGKTPLANRSLTEQFTARHVHKKYLLLTDRAVPQKEFTVKTALAARRRKICQPARRRNGGNEICTPMSRLESKSAIGNRQSANDRPAPSRYTGRTHQIRVHAAENGFPILGDTLYGGTAAARVFLHAGEIAFTHPATGGPVKFSAPPDFDREPRLALRTAMIEPEATNAFRIVHGASDGWPGWFVEKLGDFLLSQSEAALNARQSAELSRLANMFSSRGAYHKILSRHVRKSSVAGASPQLCCTAANPSRPVNPAPRPLLRFWRTVSATR